MKKSLRAKKWDDMARRLEHDLNLEFFTYTTDIQVRTLPWTRGSGYAVAVATQSSDVLIDMAAILEKNFPEFQFDLRLQSQPQTVECHPV